MTSLLHVTVPKGEQQQEQQDKKFYISNQIISSLLLLFCYYSGHMARQPLTESGGKINQSYIRPCREGKEKMI